jgi:hypothetical protein
MTPFKVVLQAIENDKTDAELEARYRAGYKKNSVEPGEFGGGLEEPVSPEDDEEATRGL